MKKEIFKDVKEALKEKYFAEKVDNFRIFIKNKLKK